MESEATLRDVDIVFREEPSDERTAQRRGPLSEFRDEAALVLLGDPGSGKTTSFKAEASIEPDSVFADVSDFLHLPICDFTGKTVFIDGLDEQRAQSQDGSVFDRLRSRLAQLGKPRFRLSCRTTDWYGREDATSLSMVASGGRVAVLHIEPLTDEGICEAIRDAYPDTADFMAQADRFGIQDLVANPQTLGMLLGVVLQEGRWPRTRAELFDKSTRLLARELSPKHMRGRHGKTVETILDAAGHLCVIHLCGGSAGFALSNPAARTDFPHLSDLVGEDDRFQAAARRRVFRAVAPELVAPAHRTIAEYLAGTFLAGRIRSGLPLPRALNLLGVDHRGAPSHLRGVYAWLACLAPCHAEPLIARDPLAVVLYGDASLLVLTAKKALLKSLEDLAGRDPWWRGSMRGGQPFGALSERRMSPVLKGYLKRAPLIASHTMTSVLDVLIYGEERPELGDELFAIVVNGDIPNHIRDKALEAFIRVCPPRGGELLPLLDRINGNEIPDDQQHLRATLLEKLYPNTVPAAELPRYIVKPHPNYMGAYHRLLSRGLVELTPQESLPVLLESVSAHGFESDWQREFWRERFVGRLLLRTLVTCGDTAPAEKVFAWLGIMLCSRGYSTMRGDELDAIRAWIQNRPGTMVALVDHWLSATPPAQLSRDFGPFTRYRLAGASLPDDLSSWLLQKSTSYPAGSAASSFLFAKAASLIFMGHGPLNLDHLIAFTEAHPTFAGQYELLRACTLDDNYLAHHIESMRIMDERRADRRRLVDGLDENIQAIRAGRHWSALSTLSHIYCGHWGDCDQSASPIERLTNATTDEIAQAAMEGLRRAVQVRINELSPALIGHARAKGRHYSAELVIATGMELIAAEGPAGIFGVPDENLKLAVACHSVLTHDGYDDTWLTWLAANRKELVQSALHDFYDAQFSHRRTKQVPSLHHFHQDARLADMARELAPLFLRRYPNMDKHALESLFHAALKVCSPDDVADMAKDVLGGRQRIHGRPLVSWLALLLLFAPEVAAPRLMRAVGRSEERALAMFEVIDIPLASDSGISISIPPQTLQACILIGGRVFAPRAEPPRGLVGRVDGMQTEISELIMLLSNDVSSQAADALTQLLNTPELLPWRPNLLHALAIQQKKQRDAEFRLPSVADVALALSTGSPVSSGDFQELICETLDVIRDTVRNAATDGYKAFWNTDRKPWTPKREGECRDRLTEHLDNHLQRHGIMIEAEALYADEKRADLKAVCESWSIPMEIKRHFHRDLWTAPTKQLAVRYARDPAAQHRGVYVVVWFGSDFKPVPRTPKGVSTPTTAADLETALVSRIPEALQDRIRVIVVDVTRPRARGRVRTRKRAPQHKRALRT